MLSWQSIAKLDFHEMKYHEPSNDSAVMDCMGTLHSSRYWPQLTLARTEGLPLKRRWLEQSVAAVIESPSIVARRLHERLARSKAYRQAFGRKICQLGKLTLTPESPEAPCIELERQQGQVVAQDRRCRCPCGFEGASLQYQDVSEPREVARRRTCPGLTRS